MADRRGFIKSLAALTTGLMLSRAKGQGSQTPNRDRLGDLLPQRKLGKTGINVTMLGVGGAHIQRAGATIAHEIIETALAGGVRFFDNAQLYGPNEGEEFYGKYLCPKYRDIIFLMTKTYAKDAETTRKHLEGSLRRMKTDYIDLWQIHALGGPKDVDQRIEKGVLEVVLEAKKSGKVRHVGFTGHTSYQALMRMLEQTNELETCQMPINLFDPNYKSFINNVLPILTDREMGVIAMKTLANGGFLGGQKQFENGTNPRIVPNVASIKEALHFVWSLPVSVLVTGAESGPMMQEKIDIARSFVQLDEKARMQLVERVAGFDGEKVEFYKA